MSYLGTGIKLNGSRCNSSSTDAGDLVAITGHGPIPHEGGTYYHWRRYLLHTRPETRTRLLIRWLLIHALVVHPGGIGFISILNCNQKTKRNNNRLYVFEDLTSL
ncbi:hypothetical protein AVEN_214874-1 [Araneus ventricosus]|uniref:Uncharacterized protein n=1 Tax=Araneus ventricosus TaxID=182803 RepID=A0A4Y2L809_ARAVE|nr:hypothetical protein AVEN_214874-1 [Araneus ventricosus]